jgi:hypothetical protein
MFPLHKAWLQTPMRTACCALHLFLLVLLAGSGDSHAKKVKGVKSLDDKAWDEIIGGPRPVLVMFYKDNCPNCAMFNVSYRAIGRVFRDEPRVVIATVHVGKTSHMNVPIATKKRRRRSSVDLVRQSISRAQNAPTIRRMLAAIFAPGRCCRLQGRWAHFQK